MTGLGSGLAPHIESLLDLKHGTAKHGDEE